MDVIRLALENREVRESYSISGVGYLRSEDRDSIPQAADFLLTEENIHTAIVYGIIIKGDREMVVGSMRTSKVTLNPDEFLKEALGATETGRYYGGGRRGAGGFEIPIGFLAAIKDDDLVANEVAALRRSDKEKAIRKDRRPTARDEKRARRIASHGYRPTARGRSVTIADFGFWIKRFCALTISQT